MIVVLVAAFLILLFAGIPIAYILGLVASWNFSVGLYFDDYGCSKNVYWFE